jgi:hypothetical protein
LGNAASWATRLLGQRGGLILLHHDRDFATIAGVTGQALRWFGQG